jgi:hypothetical protein
MGLKEYIWKGSLVVRWLVLALDGDREQVISNGGRFKPAFAERDKKTMIHVDLRGISTNWFKTQLRPSEGFKRLQALPWLLWSA